MPWIDLALERHRGEQSTTELLDAAYECVADLGRPAYETVFVHADLWSGNTMWVAGALVGVIDWEAAGAGSPGVDLGSLRLDVALLHGPGAEDEVRRGWEAAAGRPAPDVNYWDVVAALNTSADMVGMLPTIHQAGRADLDAQSLAARRDSFLTAALARAAA